MNEGMLPRRSIWVCISMEWAEEHDADYIFGLAGNAALDALVAETAVMSFWRNVDADLAIPNTQ
jgi:hypothetical protein